MRGAVLINHFADYGLIPPEQHYLMKARSLTLKECHIERYFVRFSYPDTFKVFGLQRSNNTCGGLYVIYALQNANTKNRSSQFRMQVQDYPTNGFIYLPEEATNTDITNRVAVAI